MDAFRWGDRSTVTLNAEFRHFQEKYAYTALKRHEFAQIMKKMEYVRAGMTFTRDQMNER